MLLLDTFYVTKSNKRTGFHQKLVGLYVYLILYVN